MKMSSSSNQKNLAHREALEARRGLRPWLLFGAAAIFYFYEFFARVAPGVIKEDLVSTTGASEGTFGLAMGMYFLAYAPAQLFVGRLLDRFGTRAVVAPAAATVALGCLLFVSTDQLWVMGVGRALQGLGSAFAFLGVVYLAMVWFPPRRHGIVPGLTVAAGTLGASTAQVPLAYAAEAFGWRAPMIACIFVGLGIAVMLWFVLPKRPHWFVTLMQEDGFDPNSPEPIMTSLLNLAKNTQLWLISLAAAGLYLPISVIGDLWGVTFLNIEQSISTTEASLITTMVFVGVAIGGVLFGYLADRFQARKVFFVGGAVASTIIAIVLLGTNALPTWLVTTLLCLLGFTTGGSCLAFVMAADTAARQSRGLQLAFVNFVVMMLPVAAQPGVGFLAQEGVAATAQPTPLQELRGFGLVVALIAVGTVISFFIKETTPHEDGAPASH